MSPLKRAVGGLGIAFETSVCKSANIKLDPAIRCFSIGRLWNSTPTLQTHWTHSNTIRCSSSNGNMLPISRSIRISKSVIVPKESSFGVLPSSTISSPTLASRKFSTRQEPIRGCFFGSLLAMGVLFGLVATSEIVADEIQKKTHKIDSLSEISLEHPKGTVFLLDLDETTIDFSAAFNGQLGSKSWRAYISKATKDCGQNWHDILTLHLAQNIPVSSVEQITGKFVNHLQNSGYIVCGLTSRERSIWYDTPTPGIDELTNRQMKSIGINFDDSLLRDSYPELTKTSEFFNGIFFADMNSKGKYLKKILENSQEKPKKIVFVDDKLSQVEGVAKELFELGISNECYHYCATDKNTDKFSPLIANVQLYHLLKSKVILSDIEANKIAEKHPERDMKYYLNAVLKIYQKSS